MRLTALRQPPTDSPRPMNPRPKKRKPSNNLPLRLLGYKNTSPDLNTRRINGRYAALQCGAVQATQGTGRSTPWPELTKHIPGICSKHILPNLAPNINFTQITMPTGTQHPTETLSEERHDNEMHPHCGGEPNAWPHPPTDRRHTPPLPTTEMQEGPRHSVQGVGVAARRHVMLRTVHFSACIRF